MGEIVVGIVVVAAIVIIAAALRRRNSNKEEIGQGGGIHEDHKPNSNPQVDE